MNIYGPGVLWASHWHTYRICKLCLTERRANSGESEQMDCRDLCVFFFLNNLSLAQRSDYWHVLSKEVLKAALTKSEHSLTPWPPKPKTVHTRIKWKYLAQTATITQIKLFHPATTHTSLKWTNHACIKQCMPVAFSTISSISTQFNNQACAKLWVWYLCAIQNLSF